MEQWVSCPYDPVHRVPISRIQRHLVKCERIYPKLMICPYNATHRFPEAKIKEHIDKCPNKSATIVEDVQIRQYVRPPVIGKKDDSDEDWDN